MWAVSHCTLEVVTWRVADLGPYPVPSSCDPDPATPAIPYRITDQVKPPSNSLSLINSHRSKEIAASWLLAEDQGESPSALHEGLRTRICPAPRVMQ